MLSHEHSMMGTVEENRASVFPENVLNTSVRLQEMITKDPLPSPEGETIKNRGGMPEGAS